MASNPAVDEFQSLINRNSQVSRASHPEDDVASDVVSDTTTIAPSIRSKPSVRSSHLSAVSRQQRPLSTASEASFYNHDSSDSDGENSAPQSHLRKPSKYYLPSTYDKDAMTGPKGVIADAQAFEREKRGKRSSDFKRTMDLALPRSQSYGGASGPNSRKGSASEDADGKSEGSSDEEAVRKWRERRMEEMRGKAEARRGGSTRREPYHGTLENVSPNKFLEAVETAGRGATVVVYIFDDEQPVSDTFAQHIAALAKKHTNVHFVALHYLDAGIDRAGVPALLAYRNGNKFADILPLSSEVPPSRNLTANLEAAMKMRDMLQ